MGTVIIGWRVTANEAPFTLGTMRDNVRKSLLLPIVWRTAHRMVETAAPRDELTQAKMIRAWIASVFRFIKDPLGKELLETPAFLLTEIKARGFVQGDCDDAATLSAALCEAVGIRCAFIAVAMEGSPNLFDHVYTVAYPMVQGTRYAVEFDVTRPPTLRHARFKPRYLKVDA